MKLVTALVIIGGITCSQVKAQDQKVVAILQSLSPGDERISDCKIEARETIVKFKGDLASELKSAGLVLDESHRSLIASINNSTTNSIQEVFQFADGNMLISRVVHGKQPTEPSYEEKVFSALGVVYRTHDFLALNGARSSKTNTVVGELSKQANYRYSGSPIFLSTEILKNWIQKSPNLKHSTGNSSIGEECEVIEIPGERGDPVSVYKLFFRARDYSPVEILSFLADGSLYSITKMNFPSKIQKPNVCESARTQVFSGSNVVRESFWEMTRMVKGEPFPKVNGDHFFPMGTRVRDDRFDRPLDYVMGTRLPNNEEIKEMLADRNRGGVRYQLATHSISGNAGRTTKLNPIIRIVLLLLFFTFPIFLLGKRAFKMTH